MCFGVVSPTGSSIWIISGLGSHRLLLMTAHNVKGGILEKQLWNLTGNSSNETAIQMGAGQKLAAKMDAAEKWWEELQKRWSWSKECWGRMKQRLKPPLRNCWGNSGSATAACCISKQQRLWRRRAERSLGMEEVLEMETGAAIWLWVTAPAKSWS